MGLSGLVVGKRFARLLAAIALGSLAACASGPALPKRAALETGGTPESRLDFAATVADADIIYFPSDRAASGGRSEPAALLHEALEASRAPFAVGWDLIGADQQSLLDEIVSHRGAERDDLIARLELAGNGRAREHCRAVLRETPTADLHYIALHQPRDGAAVAETEQPMHFRLPAAGLDTFAERMTASESLREGDVVAAYRSRVASQQFAAEQIVRSFQARGIAKLLIFMEARDLESNDGVPFYVAQKLPLRQVVLGSAAPRGGATKLLTGNGSRSGFEIVDRTPATTRD